MQTPLEVDLDGIAATPRVRAAIETHVAGLEDRFGRVTACRVALKGPGAHHHTSGLYEIHIQLELPDGRAVDVGRTPSADERYADLDFALNDAFKRARRKLQDHVRRMQSQVKHHEDQPTGTVVRIDPSGEFGFIESSDGREIYFHRRSVLGDPSHLAVGSRVSFAEEMGEKGPQASSLKLLGKHQLRP